MDILVNVAKKLIYTEPMKALLIQGESLVDSIVFKLPATYGDVSLADLAFSISMTNEESEVTVTSVLTKTVGESGVDAAWSVTKSHTAVAGSFKLTLSCVDETGDVILKLVGEYAVNVRKDPSAQGFGMIADTLYEQLLAQIYYAIAHMQVIRILGTYDTLSSLESAITSPSIGDMYNVGSASPYDAYVWVGAWTSLGVIEGKDGDKGDPGDPGDDGLSAYEIAVSNGFSGTEAEWVASLAGADGVGIPTGGASGQLLGKVDGTDFNTEWKTAGIDFVSPDTIAMMTAGGIYAGGAVTAQSTPNQTVAVSAGSLITPEGESYAFDAVAALAATAADATNPRIDIVYVTSEGVVTYLAGTAASSPAQPATPANGTILAAITRAANDNTIAAGDISEKRYILKKPLAATLLWTNPSPANNFAAQTITLDLTEYSYVLVQAYLATTVQNTSNSLFVRKGSAGQLIACTLTNKYRVISSVGDGGVAFLGGFNVTSYGSTAASDDSLLIPYRIFGIKNMG
jgi:hypothetical protein